MNNWKSALTSLLQIQYPIVQAPMLGVTTPAMVAAIANEGGLGSLPVGGLSPSQTVELIRKTKALTQKPFAVNLFANVVKEPVTEDVIAMQDFLEELCTENQIPYERKPIETFRYYSYTEQIDILLTEDIPIVSFTFGMLNDESIQALKNKGVILIGTATSVKEGKLLEEKGIDVVVAQGIEAGGHRGTFLEDEPLPMVGLMSLVPQMVSQVSVPVIAAGGIYDGKTIRAALSLGAQGVQPGTAFVASDESTAIASYKLALMQAKDTDTVLTRSFSGRWARGLRNKFISAVDSSGLTIPAYPFQISLAASIRAHANQNNNKEFTALWAGQSASKAEAKPAAEIFRSMVQDAEETMGASQH
jgi:nitronate monooxygenase